MRFLNMFLRYLDPTSSHFVTSPDKDHYKVRFLVCGLDGIVEEKGNVAS